MNGKIIGVVVGLAIVGAILFNVRAGGGMTDMVTAPIELEVADIEAHWRREEELASIIDGELTPLPMLEQMRRRVADGL